MTIAKANCGTGTLDHGNTESRRCWELMVYATVFEFYGYHRDSPEDHRLVQRGSYNVRCDDFVLNRKLRYLPRADASFARDGKASD